MVQLHRLVRLRLPALRPALASSSAQLRLRRPQLPPPRRTAATQARSPHNKHFIMGHHQSQEKKKPDTIPSAHGNFDRIVEPFNLDSAPIQVAKWRSRKTGLSVVWADVEGPLVNGYFTVATEIFNDSGVPHTLEHLIFLGSEKYPYKGILDSLANRAFAKGTNAWTDTTHTAYTVTTAGSEGFLRLLPVFLDHVLYPTITSEGFTTEVYHINGKGEDAGVVYSEMQGRENGAMDLMSLRNQQLLYPPTSGYRSETGGLMEALRVLTVEQIREYHEYYYRPHNLQLIVTGKLDPTELLEVLNSQVEPSLVQHGQDRIPSGWKRPFLETPSQGGARIEKSQTVEVEFPEKDESIGEVQISWVGPSTDDFLLQTALDVLGTYLTDSAVSPLAKKFIEIDCPLCTDITFHPTDAEKVITTVYLSSVPVEQLNAIEDSFKKALAEEAASIDMGRLKMVIERAALKTANAMEVDASDCLSSAIISNFLYGSGSDLVTSLSAELQRYETLAGWSAAQWSTVFRTWLVDPPSTCIIGKPSAKLSDKLEADTKQRLEATRQKYGPEGLKKLAEKLTHAQEVNDRPYPDSFLADFPIPKLDSINWIDVEMANGNGTYSTDLQSHIDHKDPGTLPYFVQFNHIKSNFITIHVNLSPPDLPAELFSLLPAYLHSFFSLPVTRKDGSRLSYDEVVHQLDTQTVEYDINLGSPISQTLEVIMKVEKSKYATAVSWLGDLLWRSEFDVDRLRINTTKILQTIPSRKREGSDVSAALYDEMTFSADLSPLTSNNLFKQESSLPVILEKLKSEPEALVKQMEQLRSYLLKPSSLRISVSGDIMSLTEPKSTWLKHFQSLEPAELHKPLFGNAVLTSDGAQPSGQVIVMSMPSIESSYAYHAAKGPQGFDHPDNAALMVAISVLNAMESYLWKAIRGTGLAYGTSIGANSEIGHVYLNIYRSPDSSKAFLESGRVIQDLVDKKLKFDDLILESAKSSSVFGVACKIATGPDAAYRVYADVALKGISKDALRHQLELAKSVTQEDVLESIRKYILPIFDSKTSLAAIASSSTKSESISDYFKQAGYKVETRELQKNACVEGLNEDDETDSSSSASSSHP
ncbi:hypothetical protein PSTG_13132 [Puccinia striiformis f. sp. tritici PST-78]|uniref:Mitochondrial presequence protease n=1 Tax=Puccinia striiformis f. sp. tritici PST-78 TaxID=1165861 RepID=A0A0L0V3H2_9BASI|nr:hypothetical protein PSTG_13132 [Puccinia striiformis f. sp. tritici PST-78]